MNITINGKLNKFTENLSLAQLISEFCKNPKHVIAEVNESIIKTPLWETTQLKDGDSIELVSFVGGG